MLFKLLKIMSSYGRQRVVPLQGGSYSSSLVFFSSEGNQRGFDRMSLPTSGIGLALDGGSYFSIVRIYVVCQGMVQAIRSMGGHHDQTFPFVPSLSGTSVIARW